MFTPHPPRPPFPPPGGDPAESDESLAAPLRAGSDAEASRSVALLMARHWRPVQDYAVICLAAPGPLAHMVTAAAFHQVLGRVALGEPAEALRPRLLVAVRDTVLNWSGTGHIAAVLPGLGKPAGGRGMRTAKSLIPENRLLVERSFTGLPRLAQALLWHTEVEAEPAHVPAGLLGMAADVAAAALAQARDAFREGCVRAHRELAPSTDCRHYNRLLDIPIRRGGALLPDVERHLAECSYCRHAAEQLGHVEADPGVLLAEAILGWGARRYLDSRPGRRPGPARGTSRRSGGGRRGRPGPLTRLPALPGRRRGDGGPGPLARPGRGEPGAGWSSRTLLTGVGVASAALLAVVLAVSLRPDGGDGSHNATGPRAGSPSASATGPGAAGLPNADRRTRLRDVGTGLCLDVKGRPAPGASAVLAVCSTAGTQQWTYDGDGLLRSAAGPGLCLDSHADAGVVILGTCAGAKTKRGGDVRYELTGRGELLPRWDTTLALAPAGGQTGADIVVKVRDHTPGQRWRTDRPTASPGSLSVAGSAGPPARSAEPAVIQG